ncbi:putative long-chain-alcohol O-fatty-acyltransferase 5 [Cucumis melo var. makuwa]|uniref:Long-chain-alcohol O-fatty-acyltransferase 5 n=3 Tax=Cucumis melo TaxID=3656 RepID=A0A5A7TX12_CUCMM|nr:putative long-chain-alcohol O-fatty-acyltransferase 5 [Cucumis melo var. makuwa]TYK08112.1 putative long-chain-alcohol O-fatty-acyltransferase 5 [Cucumis melo var. makuwa]
MNDGEFYRLAEVWTIAIPLIAYSYYFASKIPKGIPRLLALFPVLFIFLLLPLNLRSFHLCGPTAFFLSWLGNFKLLLFAFDLGPLFSSPLPSFLHFAATLCLPIKISSHKSEIRRNGNPIVLCLKVLLLAIVVRLYDYRNRMDPAIVSVLYFLHLYFGIEIVLAVCSLPGKAIFGAPFEPQFDEPYLSTSLQDFWSRRWNLMVPSILRPAVYDPTRIITSRAFGRRWAQFLGMVATFVVSGLMHELIFYYFTRAPPTWEVTCFFVLHGFCMAAEVAAKAAVAGLWNIHPMVSGPISLVFLMATARWLMLPQLIRNGVVDKAIGEYYAMAHFLKGKFI